MFRPIEPIVEGVDLAICHLEVPLSPDNRDLSGYPSFNAPRQVAEGMAAVGYDGCSTASNHSFDQGISGIESTLSVLADAGLAQAGMAVSAEAGRQATLYAVGDHTVAHLSATYWLNGYRLPDDKPWLVQLIDVPSLLDQARAARQDGADVVVASVHCCTEYQATPTGYQRDVARTLIASPDIDLVVGHHAHVVQPIEEISGEYIVYGLGNFLSAQRSRPATQDGVIVTVEFALRGENWSVRGLTAYPTWVEGGSYKILPAGEHNPASWARTSSALRAEGVDGLIVER
jgi:poly-gamma-glutamate synthesis protein (capsule biosynthesis protein)